MSYKAVRTYFITRLQKNGFTESGEMTFTNDNAMKDKFILRSPSLESEDPRLGSELEPNRQIDIHLALKLADSKTQNIDYQTMCLRIEQLIKEIPNPTNFQASGFGLRNVRFRSCTENDNSDWIEFILTFDVEENLAYA